MSARDRKRAEINRGTYKRRSRAGRPYALSPKEKKFCEEYVETRNGAESVRRSYELSDKSTKSKAARAMAVELLRKPKIQNEIEYLMFRAGLSLNDVVQVHKRNLQQDKDLSVSQRAVSDYYKATGKFNNEEQTSTKIAFIIEEK